MEEEQVIPTIDEWREIFATVVLQGIERYGLETTIGEIESIKLAYYYRACHLRYTQIEQGPIEEPVEDVKNELQNISKSN